jgi:trk system potassium uptake protein TrkH
MITLLKTFSWLHRIDFTVKIFFLIGIIMLIPLVMLIPFEDESGYASSFMLPSFITFLIGLIICFIKQNAIKAISYGRQHETVIVFGIWVFAFLIGSAPFIISGQLNFISALFESVSGWTTTGLSVMNVEHTPNIFLFYRSLLQFCGGLGIILLLLIFSSGPNAVALFSAEGHVDKLEPNLKSTARLMVFIYLGFTLFGAILYVIFSMPWFDAVNHAMTALSTGGFSTRVESIGYFQSIPIETITIFLMLLGSTNFAILALLLKRDFRKLFKYGELKFFFSILILSLPAILIAGTSSLYPSMSHAWRIVIFQAVSGLTTTGFSTATFNAWHHGMLFILIILMLIGGGSGSTAGGIKYTRVYIIYKAIIFNLKSRFRPEKTVNLDYVIKSSGKIYLDSKLMLEVSLFAIIYLTIFGFGALILMQTGIPIEEALFEFASALGTVGLSVGVTSAEAGNLILIIQIAGMILGRLEIFIVLVAVLAIANRLFHKTA